MATTKENKSFRKRILNSSFKIFKPSKKAMISYPVFLFEDVKSVDVDKIKAIVFSPKRKVLFFVYNDEDFTVVPLDTAAVNFFKRKVLSNLVIYNCPVEKIEDEEGRIVSLFYETT